MIQKMPSGKILFYNHQDTHYIGEESYYIFTNYSPTKLTFSMPSKLTPEGEVASDSVDLTQALDFPDVERAFHAFKFTQNGRVNIQMIDEIRRSSSPREAQNLASTQNNIGYDTKNWWFNGWGNPGYCYRVMLFLIKEKAKQNHEFRKKLIGTDEKELIENAGTNDKNWGNGEIGNGAISPVDKSKGGNWLGEILMKVRRIVKKEDEEKLSTQPSSEDSKFITGVHLDAFKEWLGKELDKRGLEITELRLEFRGNDIIHKLKEEEMDDYKKKIVKEMEKIVKEKSSGIINNDDTKVSQVKESNEAIAHQSSFKERPSNNKVQGTSQKDSSSNPLTILLIVGLVAIITLAASIIFLRSGKKKLAD